LSVNWIEQLPDLVDHQDQSERQQHLGQMIAAVQQPHEHGFQQQPGQERDGDAADHRQQVAAGGEHDPVGQIRAQHIERAVGEIDDAENAEHQRQSAGHQEQHHSVLHGIQELNAKGDEVHGWVRSLRIVMAGLVPAIHVLLAAPL
jgi:hypothetical protein